MAHRDNLGGRVLATILHHVWLQIGIGGVVAKFLQQCGVPVVGMLYFILASGTSVDDEVLVETEEQLDEEDDDDFEDSEDFDDEIDSDEDISTDDF